MTKIRHIAITAEDPFVDDLDGAEASVKRAGATPQPPPKVA